MNKRLIFDLTATITHTHARKMASHGVDKRPALLQKIREEGTVEAKGRKFSLTGSLQYGLRFSEEEWTIIFIVDKENHGVLENAATRTVRLYDSYESDWAFAEHRWENHEDEFIGFHRSEQSDDQCTDPVFVFRHSLFENYVFDTRGVIVTKF